MPFWDRRIDLVVLTIAEDAYLAGLIEVVERYDVQQIIRVSEPPKVTAAYLRWRDLVAQKRVSTSQAHSGLHMALDRDVTLDILHPSDDAKESQCAIAELRSGSVTLLFAEGANAAGQRTVLASSPSIEGTILIAPKKINPEFFDAVNPQYAIVFAGKSARDKPSAGLLTTLARSTILDTATHGTIEMLVDGGSITIKTVR